MTSEDTAVPCPYARLIVGKRHCRVLILGYNSDATGIDISPRPRTFAIRQGIHSLADWRVSERICWTDSLRHEWTRQCRVPTT